MKRVIKDFKAISPEVMALINEQYPAGYDDHQLVTFVNAKGAFVKALEVRTEDIIYLIKLDRKLDDHISEYVEAEPEVSTDGDISLDADGDSGSVDVEMEDSAEEDDD